MPVFLVAVLLLAVAGQVTGTAPDVISVSPDTEYAGFVYPITISGEHFTPGLSVNLSRDTTSLRVSDLTVLSNSSVTCKVTIPADAPPGGYQVTVTNPGSEEVRLNEAFHVEAPANPEILNITPNQSMAGNQVQVRISGRYLRSGGGAVLSHGGQNVTITNYSASYDGITGSFPFPVDAEPGSWNLTVINPDGKNATHTGAFEVTALPAPLITGVSPNQGSMDTVVQLTITGEHLLPGASFVLSRAEKEIPGEEVMTESPGRITGSVTIPAKTLEGLWDLTVMNPDGQAVTRRDAYLSGSPYAPFSLHISPAWGIQGKESRVTIHGMGFLDGDIVTLNKGDVVLKATDTLIKSDSEMICTIPIPSDAETGAWDVWVTSRYGKSDTLRSGFTIFSSSSLILADIVPKNAEQGEDICATISGNNLQNGSRVSLTAEGEDTINAGVVTWKSPGEMEACFHIPGDAMPDFWNLTLTSPSGKTLSRPQAIRVTYNNTPVIVAMEPDRAPVGTRDMKIKVTGKNFGDGEFLDLHLTRNNSTISADGTISYKGTLITGYLSIPNGTPTGWYDLSVVREREEGRSATKSEFFRVL